MDTSLQDIQAGIGSRQPFYQANRRRRLDAYRGNCGRRLGKPSKESVGKENLLRAIKERMQRDEQARAGL